VAHRKLHHRLIRLCPFCLGALLTFFVYLYPFKSYSTFFIRLENPFGGKILGVLGILNPLAEFGDTATPKSD
jgi:hypothetical protein